MASSVAFTIFFFFWRGPFQPQCYRPLKPPTYPRVHPGWKHAAFAISRECVKSAVAAAEKGRSSLRATDTYRLIDATGNSLFKAMHRTAFRL